ncbi:protein Shroom2-like isoform X3 [Acipenser ruthenus]|uniref:protein Shroom2-like isoform X3 n=1 Tax=Acipenser ruthenus TaxID=7906 RepID=UPI002741E2EE|nr:protein Shroom2-like isoform X3 [Acipenser ruthenus]
MDIVDHRRTDQRFTDKNQRLVRGIVDQQGVEIFSVMEQRAADTEGTSLVEVVLTGGAPWGFTLKGGLEHREPLLITKIEEGSKAAAAGKLQAGDEIVSINEFLTGYRQEAICLVKGSHKLLTLVVKRKMKMVDIVAQKMPSETDVHVARSFLTKILRSSMRKNRFKGRNEPVSRPHSWHSTKFTESQSEAAKTKLAPAVWSTRCDASSFSHDLSNSWDQTNLQRVSDQFSSLGSMDSLDHSSHSYQHGRLSPAKSNNSIDNLGGGSNSKRDSAYSSFSTSSSTPDYTLSKSNAASTENMLYKVGQCDSGRYGNGRHSQSLNENSRLDDRQGYLQLPARNGGRESPRTEEQPGSRHSSSGRSSFGPVWHVPEKKKRAPSPPPPPPPVRSDSFAATKVHEKGLLPPYSERPATQNVQKPQPRVADGPPIEAADYQQKLIRVSERGPDARRSYNPPPKKESPSSYLSMDSYNNNQLNANRLQSLSSTDVRIGQPPNAYVAHHQRQYSDESTLYTHTRSTAVPKQQSVGSYYSSMQELPTGNFNQYYNQAQVRTSSASLANPPTEQNMESAGHSRYYCVTARQPAQSVSQASLVKVENWKGSTGTESAQGLSERNSAAPTKVQKPKYPLPHPEVQENNGYYRLEDSHDRSPASMEEMPSVKPIVDERGSQKSNSGYHLESHYIGFTHNKQDNLKNCGGVQQRSQQKEPQWPEDEGKICPQKTPMLHSLAQESKHLASKQMEPPNSRRQDALDPLATKQQRRSDRYATTLRNEIQMRRAKLQKSKSDATLTGPNEVEEEAEIWKEESAENSTSSSDGSFNNTYKDHLKEAQARVLGATSFRRRDLEPVLLEHPASPSDTLPSYPTTTSSHPNKDANLQPAFLEAPQSKLIPVAAGGASHTSRIGGRKRFTAEQKVRSYSEPDKMNEVGVGKTHHHSNNPDKATTFADRRKFFESTSKPAFLKPANRPNQQGSFEEQSEVRSSRKLHPNETEESWYERRARAASFGYESSLGALHEDKDNYRDISKKYSDRYMMLEQQRLGTFAEYEATWNEQRKPSEAKNSGMYHSADNILDSGVEEHSKPQYVHERSRSSPSADFYGKNIVVQAKKKAENSQTDQKLPGAKSTDCNISVARLSDGRHKECKSDEKLPVNDQSTEDKRRSTSRQTQPEQLLRTSAENRERAVTLPSDYGYIIQEGETEFKNRDFNKDVPTYLESHTLNNNRIRSQSTGLDNPSSNITAAPYNKKKGPVPQRPPPPKLDKYKRQDIPSSLIDSSESLLSSQRAVGLCSPSIEGPLSTIPAPALDTASTAAEPARAASQSGENQHGKVLENEHRTIEKPDVAQHTTTSSKYPCLLKPSMDVPRSPSPQFAPQRLTDKPPVSIKNETPSRIEKLMENNTTVKMVPIKILHSESHSEKESRQYLLHNIEPISVPDQQEKDQIKTLGTKEQSYSLFCAYTRQKEEQMKEEQDRTCDATQNELLWEEVKDSVSLSPANNAGKANDRAVDDLKTEELAREIVGKDRSLADILDPNIKMKTTMDLMEGIFPKDEQLLEEAQQRRKILPKQNSPKPAEEKKNEESTASLATSSSYYNTSAPKAELLIKMKDMQEQIVEEEEDSEDELDHDLSEKKQELIDSISRKLQVLREARESLQEDIQANIALGEEVEEIVKQVCKPNEFDKFRMFIGDLDKVVSLLLSLSGRLARVENALNSLDETASTEEKRTLTDKRKLLIRQHEDAKELKENLDRRERVVFDILASYLNEENLADYEHFVKMKSALIIEQRKLEDKIKLGEEQLKGLTDSLPLESRQLEHRITF